MPAVSKAQQKFMGMVHTAQKGEKPASAKVAKVAKKMKKKSAKDFASTKHKGLPYKVKQEIINKLRELVRRELEENFYDGTKKFEKKRTKNAEVLGYKLTGTPDVKTELSSTKGEERVLKRLGDTLKEELYNSQGPLTDFKKGDLVKDINPDCPHHGSEGEVTKGGKKKVTYKVTNNGATYKEGDELEKTVDQMVKLKESVIKEAGMGILDSDQSDILQGIVMRNKNKSLKSILNVALKSGYFKNVDKKELLGYIDGAKQFVKYMKSHPMESVNEGFTKYHIRLTKTPGWYGVWDKNGKQKFEGDRKYVTKHLKKLKTRMGNFQLKSLIDVATKRKGKDIEFDVVESVTETKKRDYKAEYKKYGSSTKAKKYRAELNKYNRQKGTYGNGDGKDASHKGGKIAGFEKESTNRGRREKSRLKKEDIREFKGSQAIHVYLGGIVDAMRKAGLKAKTAKQMKHGFSKSRDKIGFFIDVEKREIEGKKLWTLQLEVDKDGYLWYLSAPKDIKIGKWADRSQLVRGFKKLNYLPGFGQDAIFKRRK